jgi:hypothetical protein
VSAGAPRLAAAVLPSPARSSRALELVLNGSWLGFMGLTFYWMFTYSGPHRFLCEWQNKTWGHYYPALSIIVLNLPPALAIGLVRKMLGLGPAPRTLDELIPLSGESARVFAVPALLFVGMLALGGSFYWSGVRAGDLRAVHADELLSGSVTDAVLYADVRGVPDERIVSTQEGGAIPVLYIPLHGSGGEGEPAPVVIQVQENLAEEYLVPQGDTAEVLVRGLMEQDVPRDVAPYLTQQGVRLSTPCWLVRPKVNPEQRKTAGLVVSGLGAVIALFAYVMRRRALQH